MRLLCCNKKSVNSFLNVIGSKKNLTESLTPAERLELVSLDDRQISLKRQCELLEVNRTSAYRKRQSYPDPSHGESRENLDIMRIIDETHLEYPSWGYRKMTDHLRANHGYTINRKRVRRLMRLVDIIALFPGPNLSKRYHAQYVRPYLLRNVVISRPDQVWGVDITYLPLRKGFLYLFVIIDWYTREVVDYEMSYSLEKGFVLRCLERALAHRQPEIINSDQGSHFTCQAYLDLLASWGIRVSMNGKGRALDNARTERFFRSLKYDDIYINEYVTPREMIKGVNNYMSTYNTIRPHASLGGLSPQAFKATHMQKAAA
jgi:putative transposase